jgi:predicted nucleic acid-binding protein
MLVYLDSPIVIYAVEGLSPFQARAQARLLGLQAAGDHLAVSGLTELECYVRPLRLGLATTQAHFDRFFANPQLVQLLPPTTAYRRAARIRARWNFGLADSLHLATAIEAGCDRILTNDLQLQTFPDIAVEILP